MKKVLFTLSLLAFIVSAQAQSVTRLLAVSPFDDILRVLDTNTYVQLHTVTLTASSSVNGCTGLARRNSTGIFYAVVNTNGSRYLATLNPITGSLTLVGNLGDNFAQITFNGNNTLLGVTGIGASTPSTVYRINVNNANKSMVQTIPGLYGQVICYNPSNNKVYHWTGGYPNAMRRFDTTFTTSSTITVANNSGEVMGAVYKTGSKMISYDWDQNFLRRDTTGNNPTLAAFATQPLKGLAYITCSRTITASTATVCGANGTVTFTMSGTPGAQYQWFKNNQPLSGATSSTLAGIGGGYYKCLITDGCGIDSLAAGKNIVVGSVPVVSITGSGTSICPGQSVSLVGSSGGASQWYKNGVVISGANTNSYVVNTPGVYNMVKTNTNGCADSSATGYTVTLAPGPTVTIIPSSTVVCAGQSATLSAAGAATYFWSTISPNASIVVSPSTTTTYSVVGLNSSSCSAIASITLNVNPLPTLTLTQSQATICINESATITANGAGTYSWNTGASSGNITVSPSVTTSYTVTGTTNGCSSISSITQAVDNCTSLQAQSKDASFNLFPNPAAQNITLQSAVGIKSFTMVDVNGKVVMSRKLNGEKVYHTSVESLPAAIYVVNVELSNGTMSYLKLAIEK